MPEINAETVAFRPRRVNAWRVTWIKSFWLAKVLCWHGKKNLRYLAASNGGDIYCDRCGVKRIGWIYEPNEPMPERPLPPEQASTGD